MTERFDLAVVGSGFAGSLTALIARRLGRSVVLLERGSHPRFAIGESSSPLANLLLEELAERYDLPRVKPLSAWGAWRRAYPDVLCGLKRGFTFYAHEAGRPFGADAERRDQLLVAASPNDDVADTHWYRPDFDAFLAHEAAAAGAEFRDRTRLRVLAHDASGFTLGADRLGSSSVIRARLVIDASGPRGFLHHALGLAEARFPHLPETEGLFAHFENVRRVGDMGTFASSDEPPYPADDAALHHVFEGGWIWVLRFANGLVSAGVSATPELARDLRLSDGGPAWDRLLSRLPTVRAQFAGARTTVPFVHRRRLPFRAGAASGPGWTLLPSAAAFVDPLLSTGFPLTLLGIERLAVALERDWDDPSMPARLSNDAALSLFEADTAALLVSALFARFHDFPVFAALTTLYFAAASYAEAARRLGRSGLSGSFLSGSHPSFGPALVRCCRMALGQDPGKRNELLATIGSAIEPLDVIGLSDISRRNWFPVDAADLFAGAHKLGATRDEIAELLRRAGLAPVAVEAAAP